MNVCRSRQIILQVFRCSLHLASLFFNHLFKALNMTQWLQGWFQQSSVLGGDPTRRAIADVHKMCSDNGQELKQEAINAGWHVLTTSTHYVLIPSGTMSVVC